MADRPGIVERLCGEVALRAIYLGQRLAIKRGDLHEASHFTAMVLYGNSGGEDEMGGCQLPPTFTADGKALAAHSAEARTRKAADRG